MRFFALSLAATVVVGLAGCGAPTQVISGKAVVASFPNGVSRALAVDAKGQTLTDAPVGADGAFTLAVPPSTGVRIQFAAKVGAPALVFPRTSGAIDSRFTVKSAATPFDLGSVRYVGDPAASTYKVTALSVAGGDQSGATDNAGDGECNDGHDAAGDVCVDDNHGDDGACSDHGDHGGDGGDGEDSGVDCVDGIDAATGAACDGGPSANGTGADGAADTGSDAEPHDDAPHEAAVADHNLPSNIGCDSHDNNDNNNEGDQQDGEHQHGEQQDGEHNG